MADVFEDRRKKALEQSIKFTMETCEVDRDEAIKMLRGYASAELDRVRCLRTYEVVDIAGAASDERLAEHVATDAIVAAIAEGRRNAALFLWRTKSMEAGADRPIRSPMYGQPGDHDPGGRCSDRSCVYEVGGRWSCEYEPITPRRSVYAHVCSHPNVSGKHCDDCGLRILVDPGEM